MPSPIGHSLISFAIYPFLKKKINIVKDWRLLVFILVIGNLPDLDFIPGILVGNLNKYHQGLTHTLGFALIVSIIVWLGCIFLKIKKPLYYTGLTILLLFIHYITDCLNMDSRPPIGVNLFWPFLDKHIQMPFPIFYPFNRTDLSKILSLDNLIALGSELIGGGVFLLSAFIISRIFMKVRKLIFFGLFITICIITAIFYWPEKGISEYVIYEVENMHRIVGEVVNDPAASGCKAVYTKEKGHLAYGPYINFPKGQYIVTCSIKIEKRTRKKILELDVVTDGGKKIITRKIVTGRNFREVGKYQNIKLAFKLQEERQLEFRIRSLSRIDIWADYIKIKFYTRRTKSTQEFLKELKGKIVFASVPCNETKSQIYIMDVNGNNLVRLTNTKEENSTPYFSYSGRKITFASYRDGNGEIYIMDSDGRNQKRLTFNKAQDHEPSWYPDGKKIIFTSNRNETTNFYEIDINGKNLNQLTFFKDYTVGLASVSPCGGHIAFTSNMDLGWQIYTLDLNTKELKKITGPPQGHCEASWSPDGENILCIGRWGMGNSDIYLIDKEGQNKQRLTEHPAQDYTPRFSPDGKKIIFSSIRDGNWELYVMNLTSKNQARLTYSRSNNQWPDWTYN